MADVLFISFIVLSFLGFLNAAHLVYKHYKKKPLICPMGQDCSVVLESRWSSIFFVRNEVLGLVFFLALLAGGVVAFFEVIPSLLLLLVLAAGFGVLFSLFLIWVQVFKIKSYCSWCLLSALLTLLVFLNGLWLYI